MIVAEIGLNHLGSIKLLKKYLESAVCVDALTIQILSNSFFKNKKFSSFKLTDKILLDFILEAKNAGYKVGLAIDDYTKVEYFDSSLISFYKILSKDINNKKLIDSIMKTSAKDIYISTGMSDLKELDDIIPSLSILDSRFKLIHTQLSNEIEDVNLKAIELMRDRYHLPVAYGHHCVEEKVIYASLGFSPESIFFYIKGGDNLIYPDDFHALDIDELDNFVMNIKSLNKSIGEGIKIQMNNNLRKV
jgi:N,N'-diacetyllegionaminate synthase